MIDPDFTSLYKMRNPDFTNTDNDKMDFNTIIKDNWEEVSGAPG